MTLLIQLARYGAVLLVSGFAAVIAWKIAVGDISLDGLLDSSGPRGSRVYSPARLQLLIATVVVSAQYLSAVARNPHRDSLPALPDAMIAVLASSNAIYLGGKALSIYVPLMKKWK